MAQEKTFYFVDTRENAKTKEAFGITNPDVAKKWIRDFNMEEGPFEPVDAPESQIQINRRDLKLEGENTTPNQIKATEHNMSLVAEDGEGSPYDHMTKDELKDELDARGIEYKKSGPESTNLEYVKLLVADDNE